MKAVILTGGKGKRLEQLTHDIPKVLVKVGEKTLIEHNIDKLRQVGINEIAVVVGYKGQMVRDLLGNSVVYYEQKEQLGTAHAFGCVEPFIKDQYFLAMNGDIYFEESLDDFLQTTPPAIALYKVHDSSRYGRIEVKDGNVTVIKEKSPEKIAGFINAGIYTFPKIIFDAIRKTPLSPRNEYEITDTIMMLANQGVDFHAYTLTRYWTDIATLSDLETANKFAKR